MICIDVKPIVASVSFFVSLPTSSSTLSLVS